MKERLTEADLCTAMRTTLNRKAFVDQRVVLRVPGYALYEFGRGLQKCLSCTAEKEDKAPSFCKPVTGESLDASLAQIEAVVLAHLGNKHGRTAKGILPLPQDWRQRCQLLQRDPVVHLVCIVKGATPVFILSRSQPKLITTYVRLAYFACVRISRAPLH